MQVSLGRQSVPHQAATQLVPGPTVQTTACVLANCHPLKSMIPGPNEKVEMKG